MQVMTSSTLQTKNEGEISSLCAAYAKAMEASEPFSQEWRFAQWGFEATMRERRRRLHRVTSVPVLRPR